MPTPPFTPAKRVALALSGLAYLFAAPFVIAEGIPFTAIWIAVGLGLARQMLLAIAPAERRPSEGHRTDVEPAHGTVETPHRNAPAPIPETS
jgi:hypothetical protein